MSTEIIVSLIAFIGVIVSVSVSLYTSSKQTKNELHKMRLEIQHIYSDKLLEKRLEIYPNMYFLLSDFSKKMETGKTSQNDFDKFHEKMSDWNSHNSLFFSGKTGLVSYHFRRAIRELLAMDNETFDKYMSDNDKLAELKAKFSEFELSLKSDIGIYVVEFADISKRFISYQTLDNEVSDKKLKGKIR